jgi:hypothetical protein
MAIAFESTLASYLPAALQEGDFESIRFQPYVRSSWGSVARF